MGFPLATLGIFALVYQGFGYTHREWILDLGPIHATRDDTERVPLPSYFRREIEGRMPALAVSRTHRIPFFSEQN
jgi:hypothetical protein